ncbi:hypothetical protein CHARACLAT_032828 [Characodon lateralis]|uniref:Uncharacterized protein n=1 Tax=Characodon lateralis TaxID=208331 RepID=A0ABU7DLR2_9TELE|nr:hypothetical protein [Characodon lateralis]
MTPSDPVEELCLFTSKETLARCVSLSRSLCDPRRGDRTIGKVGVLCGQWHHGKSAVPPSPHPIYLESSRNVCTASFMFFHEGVHSYSSLENCLRVHLLSCLSLLDEATKGAITINVFLCLPIESTLGSVLLCSFYVSALFSQTPSRLWQMAAHTEPGSAGGFFLLKGSFSSPLSLHACSL